jgi:hypothetical protein
MQKTVRYVFAARVNTKAIASIAQELEGQSWFPR